MKKKFLFGVLLTVLLTLCLCACGKGKGEDDALSVRFVLSNTVEDRITVLAVSFSGSGNTISSEHVEIAGSKGTLAQGDYTFRLEREQMESEEALKNLSVKVSLSEGGDTIPVATVMLADAALGDAFFYELIYEDGEYRLCAK